MHEKYICLMQPHFFPAFSYFELISRSDKFIFLTKVQLSRQSYQTRNRIIANGNTQWVNCSVARPAQFESKLICNAKFPNLMWKEKLSKTLKFNYAKSEYKKCVYEVIDFLEDWHKLNLCDFNIALIKFIVEKLGISTEILLDSQLDLPEDRSLRIIELMRKNKKLTYLYTPGSEEYMVDDNLFSRGFKSAMFEYTPLKVENETSRLSFIELVANYGWSNFKLLLEARNGF